MSTPARLLTTVLGALLLALSLGGVAQAATITVDTTEDLATPNCGSGHAAGTCSLRGAIAAAVSGTDTVVLGAHTYAVTRGTLLVTKSIAIQGAGVASTTISGAGNSGRIMKLTSGSSSVADVSFIDGNDIDDEAFEGCSPCFTINGIGGGAIYNDAGLTLTRVAFSENVSSSTPNGGAVSNSGTLTLTDVTFAHNTVGGFGGGLFQRSGTVNATGVTFAANGNTSGSSGSGAFLYGGTASFTNTTFNANGIGFGRDGGLDNYGASLTLDHVTFSGDIRGSLQTDQGATTSVKDTIIGSGFADGSDFACIAAGVSDDAGKTTTVPITSDLGGNIDQDGVCESHRRNARPPDRRRRSRERRPPAGVAGRQRRSDGNRGADVGQPGDRRGGGLRHGDRPTRRRAAVRRSLRHRRIRGGQARASHR